LSFKNNTEFAKYLNKHIEAGQRSYSRKGLTVIEPVIVAGD
jgi:hypothetical protein